MKIITVIAMTAALAGCSSANSISTSSLATPTSTQAETLAPATTASNRMPKRPVSMTLADGTVMNCDVMNSKEGFYSNVYCDHPPTGATLNY